MKKIKRHGFTLAEVLITLSIIGVVAALTIPTLHQRTGNEELISRFFKAYSTLTQAVESIVTEEGSAAFPDLDTAHDSFKKYLRVAKDCGSAAGCWAEGTWKNPNGADYEGFTKGISEEAPSGYSSCGPGYKLTLQDGVHLFYAVCGKAHQVNMIFDSNGSKGPNKMGRDQFFASCGTGGMYLHANYKCDPDSTKGQEGYGCTMQVLAESAMNY